MAKIKLGFPVLVDKLSKQAYLTSSIRERVARWARNHPKEALILGIILLVGAFLRLYKIADYMTFLGDEGRDVIVVRRLLVHFDPILVGPGTSIGNMYLGPLYYYLMAPALLLANFSPVGPAIMVALLGVATIFLIWFAARRWFGGVASFIASSLYTVSPTVIIYSRSSWNPNIMPFFSLLLVYSIWQFWQARKYKWLVVAGLSLAFALQSHYLGLLLLPVFGLFWLVTWLTVRKTKGSEVFWRYSTCSAGLFFLLMSPLFIFDARHGWRNFEAMKLFFTQRQTTISALPWNSLTKLWPLGVQISERLLAGYRKDLASVIAGTLTPFVLGGILLYLRKMVMQRTLFPKDKTRHVSALFLLSVWIMISLVGMGLYKQHIYDHYFGFVFAAPFILLGGVTQMVINQNKLRNLKANVVLLIFFVPFFTALFTENFSNNPLKYPPNRQLERSREVAKKMIEESEGEKFNIAVIAERNYEGAYQYYLERLRANFVVIDPQRADDTITEQLFVVCELPKEKCDPTHNDKAEVANFGWSKIDEEWNVFGTTLFKLVHTQK